MDLRIEKTEKAIREAFFALRAQKPLEKIRVKELCEAACIHKSTFYTHYQDIYALAETLENETVARVLQSVDDIDPSAYWLRADELTRRLARAFLQEGDRVQVLFSGRGQGQMVHLIEAGLHARFCEKYPAYAHSTVFRVVLSFCVYGSFYAFENNRDGVDSERLVEVLGKISRAAQEAYQELGPAAQPGAAG